MCFSSSMNDVFGDVFYVKSIIFAAKRNDNNTDL